MNNLFLTPICSESDGHGFLFQLYQLGLSYHPEDNAREVVRRGGERVFTDSEAAALNLRMFEAFEHVADPCAFLLDLMHGTDRE